MSLKDELLRQADDDLGDLKRALTGLSDDAMRRPCLGTWGIREILAHITGWQREMIPGPRFVPAGRSVSPTCLSAAFTTASAEWRSRLRRFLARAICVALRMSGS